MILFYVSGHGFGHATRVAEIIRALPAGTEVVVRTAAPARLFPATVQRAEVDGAVSESGDTLWIDPVATWNNWTDFLGRREAIIQAEAALVRRTGMKLIVADIPFLAGEIAAAADVPCIGISNFTWNWILRSAFEEQAGGREALRIMEDGYGKMTSYWRLPFTHSDGLRMFREIVDTPLIAQHGRLAKEDVRRALGVADFDRVILVAFRGQLSAATFRCAAEQLPASLFVTFDAGQAAGV